MNVTIDRMTLRLSGLSAAEGRRLASLIADRLSAASTVELRSAPTLRADLDVRPGESLESAADRVVHALLGPSGGLR